ncbi:MAG: alpha/beta hydrolase, partial [Solirubrobacterales bacterium]|nr:alpha/beta hydrolase [Solirubrobacterales bacterium]
MSAPTHHLTSADGRRLEFALGGPDNGALVVSHHGTPGCGSLFEPMLEEGAQRGFRHAS